MLKLLHTADVHLDTRFHGVGMPADYGNRRRQSLREVFGRIVRHAGEWPAHALLIAGDLFEHDRVTRDTINFLIAQFRSIPDVPVFIAPGNHDPYTTDSPYATETWPENVTIFARPEWTAHRVPDSNLCIHGFAFDGPQISTNPFGQLAIDSDDCIHVAVGHGSEKSHLPSGQKLYCPFDASDAACTGLRYLALGHYHTLMEILGEFETKIYYPGVPEGHNFKETGPCYFVEVEIDENEVRVNPIESSRQIYETFEVDCQEFRSSHDAIETIREVAGDQRGRQIARVALSGRCEPGIREELPSIYDTLAGEFEYLRLLDRTEPLDDYHEMARQDSAIGAFLCAINQEIEDTTDDAHREKLRRAREVGVGAFYGRATPIQGIM